MARRVARADGPLESQARRARIVVSGGECAGRQLRGLSASHFAQDEVGDIAGLALASALERGLPFHVKLGQIAMGKEDCDDFKMAVLNGAMKGALRSIRQSQGVAGGQEERYEIGRMRLVPKRG